jgi:hypothetical protein
MATITEKLGFQLKIGDRFMPSNHGWGSFGEIIGLVRANSLTTTFNVKRTARSGSTRIEVYSALNIGRFMVEEPETERTDIHTNRYNTTRARGEGPLRVESLRGLIADLPDHATIEITISDVSREGLRWWFTSRYPVERDYVAEAQAERARIGHDLDDGPDKGYVAGVHPDVAGA